MPAAELKSFIGKYNADMAAQIREVLARMRAKLPAANQLVYDNYNALAIGFASGERVADVIFSIACYPRWISLFFFPGAGFDDPGKLLKGAGKKCRHIVLRGPETLDDPRCLGAHAAGAEKFGARPRQRSGGPPHNQIRFRKTATAPTAFGLTIGAGLLFRCPP